MLRPWILWVGTVLGVILVGWWAWNEPSTSSEGVRGEYGRENFVDLRRDLDRLRVSLRKETAARRALESDFLRWRRESAAGVGVSLDAEKEMATRLRQGLPATEAISDPPFGLTEDSPGALAADAAARLSAAEEERPMFDVERLVAAGIHPQDAEELLGAWEKFSLDRLYLVDQAAREGWLFKPRFQREVAGLEHQVLEEVGEEGWDQLLYGSGQPNRVIVRQVLKGSSAEIAGLRPGDVIMRYNDRRVFKTEWLQAATARGRPGTVVRLEVLRGGEPIIVDVERGPLGTLLRNSQVPPAIY